MTDFDESEYARACAVFTKPVRFVEWKALHVGTVEPPSWRVSDTWVPFGAADKKGAWKEIDGEKWIYVFRRPHGSSDAPDWIDELHVKGDTKSSAYAIGCVAMNTVRADTPASAVHERKERKPTPLRADPRFARRIAGKPQEHFFFATRIQLHASSILELRKLVAHWVPPVVFEAAQDRKHRDVARDDPQVIDPKSATIRVGVLDPLTVLVHLHAYFAKAQAECDSYVLPNDAMSKTEKQRVHHRHAKVTLARMMMDYVEHLPHSEDGDRRAQEITGNLKNGSTDAIKTFLDTYDHQVEYRFKWRDAFARYLGNWFRSAPLRFVGRAHFVEPLADADVFLLPWLHCFADCIRTPPTRAFLDEIGDQEAGSPHPWFHTHVLPEKKHGDVLKAVRKSGSLAAKAIKEYAVWTLTKVAKAAVASTPEVWLEAQRTVIERLSTRVVGRFPGIVSTEAVELETYSVRWVAVDREAQMKGATAEAKKAGGKVKKVAAEIENLLKYVNLAVAVVSLWDDLKAKNNLRQNAVVVASAMGKAIDVGGVVIKKSAGWRAAARERDALLALGEAEGAEVKQGLAKVAKIEELAASELAGRLSFVTAVIEMVGGASGFYDDIKAHKGEKAFGDSLVMTGNALSALGYWKYWSNLAGRRAAIAAAEAGGELAALEETLKVAPELMVIGSAIVTIGYVIKAFLAEKTDFESFASHCFWGKSWGEDDAEHPAFSRVPYGKWKGRYDLQLESFISLLVNPQIKGHNTTYLKTKSNRPHEASLSVDWLPGPTEVDVIYADAGGWRIQTKAQVDWAGAPVVPNDSKLDFSNDGNGRFRVEPTAETRRNMPDDPRRILYSAVWRVDIGGVKLTLPPKAALGHRAAVATETYPPPQFKIGEEPV